MCSFFYILDLNLSFGKQWKACKERKTLSIRQSGIVSSKGIHKQSETLYIVWFTNNFKGVLSEILDPNIGGLLWRWLQNQIWLDDLGTFYLNCLNSKVGWKLRRWLKNQIWPGGGFIWIVWILAPGHFSSPGNYIWVVADKEKRERFAETAFHHIKNQTD